MYVQSVPRQTRGRQGTPKVRTCKAYQGGQGGVKALQRELNPNLGSRAKNTHGHEVRMPTVFGTTDRKLARQIESRRKVINFKPSHVSRHGQTMGALMPRPCMHCLQGQQGKESAACLRACCWEHYRQPSAIAIDKFQNFKLGV